MPPMKRRRQRKTKGTTRSVLPRRTFATWLDDTVRSIRFAAGTVHTARTVANTGTSPMSTAHDLLQSAANSLCTAAKSIISAANLVHASSPSNDPSARALCVRLRLSANWLASAATPLRSSPPSIHDALQVAAGALRKAASSLDAGEVHSTLRLRASSRREPAAELHPSSSAENRSEQHTENPTAAPDSEQRERTAEEVRDRNKRALREREKDKQESPERERENMIAQKDTSDESTDLNKPSEEQEMVKKESEEVNIKKQNEQKNPEESIVELIKPYSVKNEQNRINDNDTLNNEAINEAEESSTANNEEPNNDLIEEKPNDVLNNQEKNHSEGTTENKKEANSDKNGDKEKKENNQKNNQNIDAGQQNPLPETEDTEDKKEKCSEHKFSLIEDNITWQTANGYVSQLLLKHSGSRNPVDALNFPITRTKEATEKSVKRLHDALRSKEITFKEAMVTISDCKLKSGVVVRNECEENLYQELKAKAESLQKGEISPILESSYGLHILYCSE